MLLSPVQLFGNKEFYTYQILIRTRRRPEKHLYTLIRRRKSIKTNTPSPAPEKYLYT